MSTVEKRIQLIFKQFDFGDKRVLADELVEAIEWTGTEPLATVVASALGRGLTHDELLKVETFDLVLRDRASHVDPPPFPDDYGAPKSDR